MATYKRPIRLPNGDVFPFSLNTSVQLVPGRGVIVKDGALMAWLPEPDDERAADIRDALVDVVLNLRSAPQPDWRELA